MTDILWLLAIAAAMGGQQERILSNDREKCAQAYTAAANIKRSYADFLENEAAHLEQYGDFTPSTTQEFVGWYDKAKSRDGSNYPSLLLVVLTPEQRSLRQQANLDFIRWKKAQFDEEVRAAKAPAADACRRIKAKP